MTTPNPWSAEAILLQAHEWVWVPPGTQVLRNEWMYGLYSEAGERLHIAWVDDAASDPAQVVQRVTEQARSLDCMAVDWTCSSATRPQGLEEHLKESGAQFHDATEVMAFDMTEGFPEVSMPETVSYELVDSVESWREATEVSNAVWGGEAPSAEQLQEKRVEFQQPLAERAGFQVVARVNGVAAATGGVTRVGPVARLWGAGTIESMRGQGAYRETLHGRLRIAYELGCTLGLLNARVETSAPILQQLGLRSYGQKRVWRL